MRQAERFSMIRRWIGGAKQWLPKFLDSAPSNQSIVAVVVLGSVLRERGHRRSDFDLLALYRGKRPTIRAPLEVDIRLLPIERLEDQIAQGHEIVCWALQFGTSLYDPELFWHRLEKSWAGRVPFPSASEARTRGEQSLARAMEMLQLGDESAASDLVLAALTQFARERLINGGVFPASRPELPSQLRELSRNDSLAGILDDAMFEDGDPVDLVTRLKRLHK
jgi:predicted nucleotidyltransferase